MENQTTLTYKSHIISKLEMERMHPGKGEYELQISVRLDMIHIPENNEVQISFSMASLEGSITFKIDMVTIYTINKDEEITKEKLIKFAFENGIPIYWGILGQIIKTNAVLFGINNI